MGLICGESSTPLLTAGSAALPGGSVTSPQALSVSVCFCVFLCFCACEHRFEAFRGSIFSPRVFFNIFKDSLETVSVRAGWTQRGNFI